MTPAQRQQVCDLFIAIGADPTAKTKLKQLLAKLKKNWNDLAEIVCPSAAARSGLDPLLNSGRARKHDNQRNGIRARFGAIGSNSPNESDNAENALKRYLVQLGLMWSDLPWLIQPDPDPQQASASSSASVQHPFTEPDAPPPLAVLVALIERYVGCNPHQALACALWAMHTHIFSSYLITPRLYITSPVKGCGKSTLLRVLMRISAHPTRYVNISTATLFRAIDQRKYVSFLLDEGENLNGEDMRYVLNGNEQGDTVGRTIRGEERRFCVFTPIAFAAIGAATFHASTLSRAIKILLQRWNKRTRKLRRFDPNDTGDLDMAAAYVREWIERERENISLDPSLLECDGRVQDNWRPLVAIADTSGGDWGERARVAMLALTPADSDIGVVLLEHSRVVVDRVRAKLIPTRKFGDVIPTKVLLPELIALDEADGRWQEYRGPHGTAAPRKLTERSLRDLLEPFEVHPAQHRPLRGGKQFRGYTLTSFERAWESYCPLDERADQGAEQPPLRLIASRSDEDAG